MAIYKRDFEVILGNYLELDTTNAGILALITECAEYTEQKVKAAKAAATAVSTGGSAVTKAGKAKKGSGETKPYPKFVKLCSAVFKGTVKPNVMVTPGNHFKDEKAASFETFKSQACQDMVGQEMQFKDMFDAVHAMVEKSLMKATGVCWGMCPQDKRDELLTLID